MRIDDQPVEVGNAAEREVDPGDHSIEVSAPGHTPYRWQSVVGDGQAADVEVKLEADTMESAPKKLTTPPWMFWAAGGTALATLGTATVLAIDANARSSDQTIRTESTAANVLFITGAVAAIGTGVLFFTTDWQQKERARAKRAHVGPRVAPLGLGIGGTF
jgi:hypothetical protein